MELRIKTDSSLIEVRFNKEIDFEELGDEGYFYNSKLDKVVIMNHTSLFIWKFFKDKVESGVEDDIDVNELCKLVATNFLITNEEITTLKSDIVDSITHFINQGFLELI